MYLYVIYKTETIMKEKLLEYYLFLGHFLYEFFVYHFFSSNPKFLKKNFLKNTKIIEIISDIKNAILSL